MLTVLGLRVVVGTGPTQLRWRRNLLQVQAQMRTRRGHFERSCLREKLPVVRMGRQLVPNDLKPLFVVGCSLPAVRCRLLDAGCWMPVAEAGGPGC